jgi:chromosome segregation ATPase
MKRITQVCAFGCLFTVLGFGAAMVALSWSGDRQERLHGELGLLNVREEAETADLGRMEESLSLISGQEPCLAAANQAIAGNMKTLETEIANSRKEVSKLAPERQKAVDTRINRSTALAGEQRSLFSKCDTASHEEVETEQGAKQAERRAIKADADVQEAQAVLAETETRFSAMKLSAAAQQQECDSCGKEISSQRTKKTELDTLIKDNETRLGNAKSILADSRKATLQTTIVMNDLLGELVWRAGNTVQYRAWKEAKDNRSKSDDHHNVPDRR